MIIKIAKAIGLIIAFILSVFFLGPRPHFEKVNNLPSKESFNISQLDQIISEKEKIVEHLKEDNEARIIWADSIPTKTEYSIVYLHGFTASQGEGYPLHINIADSLHANLYLPRLPGHGINEKNVMKDLTPLQLVEAAKEALAIGKSIGNKVLLMGCSTGGTLAIYLASGDPEIAALILLSPNIAIKSSAASLMTGPWGRQLAFQLVGENRDMSAFQNSKPYWTYQHHTNGLIALQSLIDQTMTNEIFQKVKMPVYCGYYFKNEEEQDPVVSIKAIIDFQHKLKSPQEDVEFEAFAVGNHVLGSIYKNKNWKEVQDEVWEFIIRELSI